MKYSALYNGYNIQDKIFEIEYLLKNGIKVFWFGSSKDVAYISEMFVIFSKYRLLQPYVTDIKKQFTIIDGDFEQCRHLFDKLSESVPIFNSGQYKVEHCLDKNIIVRASAGTGKTTVMIDRIMYLLHVEDVNLSEIAMITFTNNATTQMSLRIQNELMNRYEATRLNKYLKYMEDLSTISISTIDSLSLTLLKRFGVTQGYGKDVSINSHDYELKKIIKRMIDEEYKGSGSLKSQFGIELYDITKIIYEYYNRLTNMGIAPDSIDEGCWDIVDGESEKLQRILIKILKNINTELDAHKRKNNTVSLADTVRNINGILSSDYVGITDFKIKYLFVDEFQDTNEGQIRLIASLAEHLDASLFIVGDSKQSIYRFRGADDAAFNSFSKILYILKVKEPVTFELINNYRTDPHILTQLDFLFRQLIKRELLAEFKPLYPCKPPAVKGLRTRRGITTSNLYDKLVFDAKQSIKDLQGIIGDREPRESEKVAILVRYNWEMDEIAKAFEEHDVPIITRRDEPFYSCDAVLDLFTLISSHIFSSEPSIVFNYLISPYSCLSETIDLKKLESFNGNREGVTSLLNEYQSQTQWQYYENEFKHRPALSVIKDIMSEVSVIENYVAILKSKGIRNPDILYTKADKYRLNLNKLLVVLHTSVPNDGISLFRIYEFLKISIATNTTEMEAEFDYDTSGPVVYCMTVHRAKGLEFDTVIIPSKNKLSDGQRREILISPDRKKIGWIFPGRGSTTLCNRHYDMLKENDDKRNMEEETRILYVAMTRAVRKLIFYIHKDTYGTYSWSKILNEAL